ncbi:MAG: ABC transporter ATP-binding protein [Candidatus Porifericomitaceae bacterium WSBS_2022_MAG_OTU9]
MSRPLLSVRDVCIRSRSSGRFVVYNLNLDLPQGKTLCLLGESGSGKSLSALAIMRLLPSGVHFNSGEISYRGQSLPLLPEWQMRRYRGGRIAMIFQDPQSSLNPVLTVGKHITEVLRLHRSLRGHALRHEAMALLDAVGLPEPQQRMNFYPHQLSGGMKQRVMIALALAGEPDLLIADEPTTALDVTIQAQLLELLQQIQRERNMAMLFITHDLAVAAKVADQVVLMRRGEIVEQAPAQRLFKTPYHSYSKELFRSLPSAVQRTAANAGAGGENPALLQVEGLRVSFPVRGGLLRRVRSWVNAVDDVSFSLRRGHTLAVVGESGSGKSTLIRGILQLLRPQRGRVYLQGVDLTLSSSRELRAMRARMQLVFQDPFASMNPRMVVADIIEEGMKVHGIGGNRDGRQQKVDVLLQQVGLEPQRKYCWPHEFSGGERQRICIARALAVAPELLLCDEPTSSLDMSVQSQILQLLIDLQKQLSLSYIFVTHDLGIVRSMADDVLVMYDGKMVEYGPATSVLDQPQHDYTKQLLASVLQVPRVNLE